MAQVELGRSPRGRGFGGITRLERTKPLIAGAGGLFRLPRALPRNLATEMAVTGDPISAERAHQAGFVNTLCAPGGALDAAGMLASDERPGG